MQCVIRHRTKGYYPIMNDSLILHEKTIKAIKQYTAAKAAFDESDEGIIAIIEAALAERLISERLDVRIALKLSKHIFNSLRGYDVLSELIEDESITEIMVNSWDRIFIEKEGRILETDIRFESEERLEDIIQNIVGRINRRVNESIPIADARLPDGSRVHIVLPPIAYRGACITIRKFSKKKLTLEDMVMNGSLSEEAANVIKLLVRARYNIFISGGTDTGKTTLLNAMAMCIGSNERVITIEDLAELNLEGVKNIIALEARNAGYEGKGEISIRDLIKAALRMRPDRIIVGEIRDGAALDMLHAYNTGHDGSISTGHGNSPKDMMDRIETMVLFAEDLPLDAIRHQMESAIDIMIHLARDKQGNRYVESIVQPAGFDAEGQLVIEELFVFDIKEGRLVRTDNKIRRRAKLERLGEKYKGL